MTWGHHQYQAQDQKLTANSHYITANLDTRHRLLKLIYSLLIWRASFVSNGCRIYIFVTSSVKEMMNLHLVPKWIKASSIQINFKDTLWWINILTGNALLHFT